MSKSSAKNGVYDLDDDRAQSRKKLSPPEVKKSNLPQGSAKNPIRKERISDTVLITTETWDESAEQPWSFDENKTATKTYKLKTRWEKGKNYAITQVLDDQGNIVCYNCAICSPITNNKDLFEFHDWYLDVVKKPYEAPTTEDENELEEAVELGYLSKKEADTALKTVEKLKQHFQDEDSILKLL